MTILTEHLLILSDLYCGATGRSRARVSTIVFGSGDRIDGIASGKDVVTGSYLHALGWFSANWPEGVAWPAGIERPGTAAAAGGTGEREAV